MGTEATIVEIDDLSETTTGLDETRLLPECRRERVLETEKDTEEVAKMNELNGDAQSLSSNSFVNGPVVSGDRPESAGCAEMYVVYASPTHE